MRRLLGIATLSVCSAVVAAACGGESRSDREAPGAGSAGVAGSGASNSGRAGASGSGGTSNGGGTAGADTGSGGRGGSAGREPTAGTSSGASSGTSGDSGGANGATGGTNGDTGGMSGAPGDAGTDAGGAPSDGGARSTGPGYGLPGSTGDCPNTLLEQLMTGQSCDPELKNVICGYLNGVGLLRRYQECACARNADGDLAWNCYTTAERDPGCPDAVQGGDTVEGPEHGVECADFLGLSCPRPPQQNCYCPPESGVWECYGPPAPPPHFDPPASVSAEKAIADLDEEDRRLLCTWYATIMVGGPDNKLLSDRPVDDDGYVTNLVCTFGDPSMPCNTMLPGISVAQCAQNLALSACEAPVSAFTNCVTSVSNVGGACSPIGEGCFDFFDVPGCDGTVLQELSGDSNQVCRVRVE